MANPYSAFVYGPARAQELHAQQQKNRWGGTRKTRQQKQKNKCWYRGRKRRCARKTVYGEHFCEKHGARFYPLLDKMSRKRKERWWKKNVIKTRRKKRRRRRRKRRTRRK